MREIEGEPIFYVVRATRPTSTAPDFPLETPVRSTILPLQWVRQTLLQPIFSSLERTRSNLLTRSYNTLVLFLKWLRTQPLI